MGIIVGVGIGFMHYIGMSTMQMKPKLINHPGLFLVSLVVAISLAILSMFIQFHLKSNTWKIHPLFIFRFLA